MRVIDTVRSLRRWTNTLAFLTAEQRATLAGNGAPVFANGEPVTIEMLESNFFGPEIQLVTSGFGRYRAAFPGLGYIVTEDGEPYEIDLAAFIRGPS